MKSMQARNFWNKLPVINLKFSHIEYKIIENMVIIQHLV